MPTSETAPSADTAQKILTAMLPIADQSGWTTSTYDQAVTASGVSASDAAQALPEGLRSLLPYYIGHVTERLKTEMAALDLASMRIRDRATAGVRIFLEILSEHHSASVKALDWLTIRPTGPLPMTELVWSVADRIWVSLGDDATGFTYASKRTTLSGVIGSTLAVWRTDEAGSEWPDFLDRRIENVMAFEAFKAKFKMPFPA